jgi:4-aminobutyrate aminotransferase-like enzyme
MSGLSISTFGGNPLSSEAASATIDVIREEGLARNARLQGDHLREGLLALMEKHPLIGEVRGMGLMQGVELVRDRTTREPAREELARLFEATRRRGLLIGKGGLHGNVVRLSPPLTIGRADVDEALRLLDASFTEVEAGR